MDARFPPVSSEPGAALRLLKVMASFYSGGTEGQVLQLAPRLRALGCDLSLACLRREGQLREAFEALGCPLREFPIRNLYCPATLRQMLHLAVWMRRQSFDVVHSYNFYANSFALPAAWLAGVPVIVASIRDRGVYLSPRQRRHQRLVCALADLILVNAESIRDWLLEQGVAEERVRVLKNGVDQDRLDAAAPAALHAGLGLSAGAPLVLMLARLNPQKGVADLIEAVPRVLARRPDCRFLLVGDTAPGEGGLLRDWQALARRLGVAHAIFFLGHRRDVPALLKAATLSVLPSYSEGLSNALIESMAAGVPVVSTRVGGTPELIEDGLEGLLVAPGQPTELAEAILRVLEIPGLASGLAQRARHRVQEEMAFPAVAARTLALYESVLAAKREEPCVEFP